VRSISTGCLADRRAKSHRATGRDSFYGDGMKTTVGARRIRPARRARRLTGLVVLTMATALLSSGPVNAGSARTEPAPPTQGGAVPPKVPVMTGSGGAVSSVDAVASRVGIEVLRAGGNATDAAIATAAALGVTEPYSTGIGGGGFVVHYDARTGRVETIDGRETAPATYDEEAFLAADGTPLPFAAVQNSGRSVGVPGTPATWSRAADRWGTLPLSVLLAPAEYIAAQGFVVDETFRQQTADNAARFALFPETARVYLPGGAPPAVGTVFRNPDLARAYRELRVRGTASMYTGRLARAVVAASTHPAAASGTDVLPGELTTGDLAAYRALDKAPVRSRYRDRDIYGMPVPSSGGIALAEILGLIEAYDARTGVATPGVDQVQYLHRLSEAGATAFADRNRWVGDVPGVPVGELIAQGFADERGCLFEPAAARPRPIPFGAPDGAYAECDAGSPSASTQRDDVSTTHLSVVDRWGNAVSYTSTIEATGGSGITVPGWGFLLNNELTDFNFIPVQPGVPDPNLPGPAKRPRSSMAPTIVLRATSSDRAPGRLELVAGSPGGASIITTVAQILVGRYDRGLSIGDAVAAPRLSSRNGPTEQAEPGIVAGPVGAGLTALGHDLAATPEIGAATAIEVLGPDRFTAAAEPSRRGGGSAMVVRPDR
jgi:gamma-glutamyltranspeptidase / glutathione hydrolase